MPALFAGIFFILNPRALNYKLTVNFVKVPILPIFTLKPHNFITLNILQITNIT